ncbi:MAG TPA: MAPEG family protein [Steroidobacteraceae bacterium]|nr:MAPEG family protein [Steroidobacteraceae bacterium]
MQIVAALILIALLQYIGFAMLVGYARGKFKVAAPAVTGHPEFERYYRVQQNTLELLVPLVPSAWLFALYVSASWAAALTGLFVIGRLWYAVAYIRDPQRRGPGFGLSFLPLIVLVLGALVGALAALAR